MPLVHLGEALRQVVEQQLEHFRLTGRAFGQRGEDLVAPCREQATALFELAREGDRRSRSSPRGRAPSAPSRAARARRGKVDSGAKWDLPERIDRRARDYLDLILRPASRHIGGLTLSTLVVDRRPVILPSRGRALDPLKTPELRGAVRKDRALFVCGIENGSGRSRRRFRLASSASTAAGDRSGLPRFNPTDTVRPIAGVASRPGDRVVDHPSSS